MKTENTFLLNSLLQLFCSDLHLLTETEQHLREFDSKDHDQQDNLCPKYNHTKDPHDNHDHEDNDQQDNLCPKYNHTRDPHDNLDLKYSYNYEDATRKLN